MDAVRLGFISDLSEQDFAFAQQENLPVLEHNVNGPDVAAFLERRFELRRLLEKYQRQLTAIGRFGRERISDDPEIRQKEQDDAKRLIDFCNAMEVPTFVCGAGLGDGLPFDEKCSRAVDVLGELVEYGLCRGVRVALYNCRWGNFAHRPEAWEVILSAVPNLGIKYDPSHAIYDGADYLRESRDWGHKFYHVHAKGTLIIDGERFEDPPAGMDQTNWGAFLAVLYAKNYRGDLVIEPHATTWVGARFYDGIRIAAHHLRPFVLP
ncbi:MAG: sugar phosphate isomerase/epimerase [Firmicutes bacterium]|jgi:sugar phosphate isomerase/epimerase|nr:sugar phosphate isomerase/epimerase [Bacillota bacterium]